MLTPHRATATKTEILNAYTQSLLLKLIFHLAQMNSDTNPLGGWRQRDTLGRKGVQTIMISDSSLPNLEVCAEFLHFFW